jgi:hypothetical protein
MPPTTAEMRTIQENVMTEPKLLNEAQAVELFTFLITAARTQVDDPCLYASMRLLTAAEKLREFISAAASPDFQALLTATEEKTEHAQIIMNDTEAYSVALDDLCEMTACYLVAHSEVAEGEPS